MWVTAQDCVFHWVVKEDHPRVFALNEDNELGLGSESEHVFTRAVSSFSRKTGKREITYIICSSSGAVKVLYDLAEEHKLVFDLQFPDSRKVLFVEPLPEQSSCLIGLSNGKVILLLFGSFHEPLHIKYEPLDKPSSFFSSFFGWSRSSSSSSSPSIIHSLASLYDAEADKTFCALFADENIELWSINDGSKKKDFLSQTPFLSSSSNIISQQIQSACQLTVIASKLHISQSAQRVHTLSCWVLFRAQAQSSSSVQSEYPFTTYWLLRFDTNAPTTPFSFKYILEVDLSDVEVPDIIKEVDILFDYERGALLPSQIAIIFPCAVAEIELPNQEGSNATISTRAGVFLGGYFSERHKLITIGPKKVRVKDVPIRPWTDPNAFLDSSHPAFVHSSKSVASVFEEVIDEVVQTKQENQIIDFNLKKPIWTFQTVSMIASRERISEDEQMAIKRAQEIFQSFTYDGKVTTEWTEIGVEPFTHLYSLVVDQILVADPFWETRSSSDPRPPKMLKEIDTGIVRKQSFQNEFLIFLEKTGILSNFSLSQRTSVLDMLQKTNAALQLRTQHNILLENNDSFLSDIIAHRINNAFPDRDSSGLSQFTEQDTFYSDISNIHSILYELRTTQSWLLKVTPEKQITKKITSFDFKRVSHCNSIFISMLGGALSSSETNVQALFSTATNDRSSRRSPWFLSEEMGEIYMSQIDFIALIFEAIKTDSEWGSSERDETRILCQELELLVGTFLTSFKIEISRLETLSRANPSDSNLEHLENVSQRFVEMRTRALRPLIMTACFFDHEAIWGLARSFEDWESIIHTCYACPDRRFHSVLDQYFSDSLYSRVFINSLFHYLIRHSLSSSSFFLSFMFSFHIFMI